MIPTFASFLEGQYSGRLEAQVCLEVLSNFPYETLEGKFANEEFRGLLVATDFTESDSTGPETMGFLDTTGCRLHFV